MAEPPIKDAITCPHYVEGINYESDDKAYCYFCQHPAGQMDSRDWLLVRDAYNRARIHVLPLNDDVLHRTVRDTCICGPSVGQEGSIPIYVHHSLDGREA